MIEHQKQQQLTFLQNKQEKQDHENDVFESVSGQSAKEGEEQQQQPTLANQNFTLTPITFPPPEKNTLKLLDIYQQNTLLIRQLKQEISRLSSIKKQNLFIQHDCVKTNFYQQQSEFFLGSLALYNERQQELQKIKKQIRAVDREQLTTIMSKNQHILDLSQGYFSKFRNIIDAKIYHQELVLLTEQKRKVHQKRKKLFVQEEQLIEKLSKSNLRSRSGIKNNNQETNMHVCQKSTRNESQQPNDNDNNSSSKISTPRKSHHQKLKRVFNLRFLHLSHLFPQFKSQQAEKETICFTLGEKTQSVPRSFVYDSKKKFILIFYSTNVILGYHFNEGSSQEEIKDNHSSSHKSNHQNNQHSNKLQEIRDFKIEFDLNCQVVFFSLREEQLYLLTSDGILRVYNIAFDSAKKQLTSQIKTILYCLNCDYSLGEIQYVAFNKFINDEILFITADNKLCRVSLQKYKTEIVRRFDQKVVYMNEDYLQIGGNILINYFYEGEQQQLSKKNIPQLFSKFDPKQSLKISSVLNNKQIYFIEIGKHGLLSGYSKNL